MQKHCNCCNTLKSVVDFYISKSAKDGRQRCCKICSKQKRKEQNKRNKKNKKPITSDELKLRKKVRDRNWRIKNPGKARARSRRYDSRLLQATPVWLTEEHKKEIDQIYAKCPKGHHVDHIIPLKGKNVCGLHVPWNLQYLPAEINLKKSNKY